MIDATTKLSQKIAKKAGDMFYEILLDGKGDSKTVRDMEIWLAKWIEKQIKKSQSP